MQKTIVSSIVKVKMFLAAAAMAVAAAASSAAALEGTQYVKLEHPIAAWQGKLVKVFSYDCRFCYRYDASVDPRVIPQVQKEAGLTFYPVHLETKGKYGRTASEFFALCLLRDQAAGRTNMDKESLFVKTKNALYEAYHRKGETWEKGEGAFIKTMIQASGISAEDFAKERKSPAVQQLADAWKASYDAAKVQGIPAFVVNGKYLVLNKSLRNAQGLVTLLNELSRLP